MIQEVERLLIRDWRAFDLPNPPPGKLAFVQICSTWLTDSGRIVFLIFKPDDASPCAVAKIIRSELHKTVLVNEHANLLSARAFNPTLRESVPRPLYCDPLDGKTVLVETALDGVPLTSLVAQTKGKTRERIVRRTYGDIEEWLAKLAQPIRSGAPVWDHGVLSAQFRASIDEFRKSFKMDSVESDYLSGLRTAIDHMRGLQMPRAPNHGDLAAGAVLVRSKGIGVIDWEYYCAEGLPLFDSLMAVIQTGFSLSKPHETLTLLDQFKMSFESNWFSEMATQWLRSGCRRFGLPESLLVTWLPLFLVGMSNSRDWQEQRRTKHGEGTWRELFSYYAHNRSKCHLTGEARGLRGLGQK